MKHGKLLKLIGIAAILQSPFTFAHDNADDYDFTTMIAAPEQAEIANVKTVFNRLTNLVFYNGTENEQQAGGFYKLNDLDSSWLQFRLPLTLEDTNGISHGIIDATDGPFNNTLALSYKSNENGSTQYLSNTGDGNLWYPQKINVLHDFTNIAATKVYGLQHFVVHGKDHQSALVSIDGNIWAHQLLPNTCFTNESCTFSNKHLASVYNGYILLQSNITEQARDESDESDESLDATKTLENKLLFSPNMATWYNVEIPFKDDEVHATFKTEKNGLITSVTSKEDGSHKLWFTKDYKEWQSFDLNNDAKVLVAKTGYENYITLSLAHDNTSDIVILDPESNTQNVFASFEGVVSGINWHNDRLYLSGVFTNFRDQVKALLVSMTKKPGDDSSTDGDASGDDSNDTPEGDDNNSEETTIDISTLRPFNG